MSGDNPFRHDAARDPNRSGSSTVGAHVLYPTFDTELALTRKRPSKTVRIISPTSSAFTGDRDMMHGISAAQSTSNHSPLFDAHSDDDLEHDSLLDPFELESEEDESSGDENLLLSTQGTPDPDPSKALMGPKLLANPFYSTVTGTSRKIILESEEQSTEASKGPGRLYDMDSFTQLLLTGDRNSPRESQSTSETYNTNSAKLTSSVSLAAFMSHSPIAHQDTSQDFQGSSWMSSLNESLSASGSVSSPVEPPSRSTNSPQVPINLNKPLPPPPSLSESEVLPSADAGVLVASIVHRGIMSELANSSNSKPPLGPVSRYASNASPKSIVITPEPSILDLGHDFGDLQAMPVSPPPSASKPPPPPPPRRHGRVRGISSSSTSSAISGGSVPLTPSSTDEFFSRPFKQQSPFPPARTPSNSSMTRPTPGVNNTSSPSMVPPPAPPPRRGSSRSSYRALGKTVEDPSQGIDSPNSDLWTLMGSPPAKSGLGPELSDTDVLAGLSELQREVDELRGKFRG